MLKLSLLFAQLFHTSDEFLDGMIAKVIMAFAQESLGVEVYLLPMEIPEEVMEAVFALMPEDGPLTYAMSERVVTAIVNHPAVQTLVMDRVVV